MEDTSNLALGFAVLACMGVVALAIIVGIVLFIRKRLSAKPTLPPAQNLTPVYQAASATPAAPASPPAVTSAAPLSPVPPAATASAVIPDAYGTPSKEPAAAPAKELVLAPSEIVFLRSEGFSPAAGILNSYQGHMSEKKVSGPQLAQNMLAAAFLGLQQNGAARLEPGKKKATLGLREVDTIYVRPTGRDVDLPSGSYEDRLLRLAVSNGPQSQHVQHLVFQVLEEDASVPWSWALTLANRGLGERGILDVEKVKGFLAGGRVNYTVPPETFLLMQSVDVDAVRRLISSYETTQPEQWELLNKEIKRGLQSRQEAPDSSD